MQEKELCRTTEKAMQQCVGKKTMPPRRRKGFAAVQGEKGDTKRISMLASAGSKDNLNPRLLIEAFGDNVRSKVLYAEIHRRELYIKKGENLAVPFDE